MTVGKKTPSIVYLAASVFCLGTLVTLINIYELRSVKYTVTKEFEKTDGHLKNNVKNQNVPRRVAWIHAKHWEGDYLRHVRAVLTRLGYECVGEKEPWDLLWSHEYPFEDQTVGDLTHLQRHQKVNHFPGSGHITNKVNLATSAYLFVPRAFRLPKEITEFQAYTKEHPDKLWVQKSNNHRGIKILPYKDIDWSKRGTFMQEYVQNPFLIDKRKFDIGIYTIMTSIDPLRVYVVDGDALFRFCSHDYYPFDPLDVDKYVVGDDYTPLWEMPSLKTSYTELSYSFKETFNIYLRQKGYNDTLLWQQLYDSIAHVIEDKGKNFISSAQKYPSTRNFFELVRFDYVLDSNLKIYLMEVNMSPNMGSGHFPANKRLYEHVLYNALNLVGVGHSVTKDFNDGNDDEMNMEASDRDIQIPSTFCMNECMRDCQPLSCQLCSRCMYPNMRHTLKLAYMEHHHRGSCSRVHPKRMTQAEAIKAHTQHLAESSRLPKSDVLMKAWFVGKCVADIKWCS